MYRSVLFLAVFIIGCASLNEAGVSNEALVGAGVGAAGGALVGNAIGGGTGAVAGGLLGGLGGGAVGHMIHKNEERRA